MLEHLSFYEARKMCTLELALKNLEHKLSPAPRHSRANPHALVAKCWISASFAWRAGRRKGMRIWTSGSCKGI